MQFIHAPSTTLPRIVCAVLLLQGILSWHVSLPAGRVDLPLDDRDVPDALCAHANNALQGPSLPAKTMAQEATYSLVLVDVLPPLVNPWVCTEHPHHIPDVSLPSSRLLVSVVAASFL
jgi:hypothetical protein